MNALNVECVAEIHRIAAALGRVPDPVKVEALQETVRTFCQIDAETRTGSIEFGTRRIDIGDFLQAEIAKFPSAEPATAASRVTPKLRPGSTGIGEGLAAAHDAKMAREISTWVNPWSAGSVNRTHQAILSNHNPALAARFKAEAKA